MFVLTDVPEHIQPGARVYIGEGHTPHTIRGVRPHKKNLLIRLEGVADRDQAYALNKQMVFVRAAELPPLPEGEYFHHQIVGLTVITKEGDPLGSVVEIITTGANDVYVVRPQPDPGPGRGKAKDILIPATEEVILDIDLEARRMVVHLLPGLLP